MNQWREVGSRDAQSAFCLASGAPPPSHADAKVKNQTLETDMRKNANDEESMTAPPAIRRIDIAVLGDEF